jgi:transaldolase
MNTKIFLDSGDPTETRQAKEMLGFLDGQTTNPSLIAKNPYVQELKNQSPSPALPQGKGAEHSLLTEEIIWEKYKEIAKEIHEILPNGSISVEVYADHDTTHDQMIEKGRELAGWFLGIFVKLPVTHEGLLAARQLVTEGINVNMTLCFSQEQAAAVHEATIGAERGQVYISPFIGRLDDIGYQGVHLIKNIIMMYTEWDSHVMVLGASIRNLSHLFACISGGADIVTVPLSVLTLWNEYGINKNPNEYPLEISEHKPIPYRDLPKQDWVLYNIKHELTDKGIETFAEDWKSLLA